MKKAINIVVIIIAIIIIMFICYAYYASAIITINKPQAGDELLKNGDSIYVEKKDTYKKGDLVLISQCTQDKALNELQLLVCAPESKEQATRIIYGVPGETIDYKKLYPNEYNKFIENSSGYTAFVGSLSLNKNKYFVITPVSKKGIPSYSEETVTTPLIYGVIVATPSQDWANKWKFLKQRTIGIFTRY